MSRLACAILLLASSSSAADAPPSQWRGPNHDGHHPAEKAWSADWPATGPKLLWKAKLGKGYSTVAVAGDRVYAVGHPDGPDDVVGCIDAATGQPVWTDRYPQDLVATYNPGGPNASPVIHGPWVSVLSKQGLFTCYNRATGQRRWRRDLVKEEGVKIPLWGLASTPLLLDGRFHLNANEAGVAIEADTGKVAWKSKAGDAGYACVVPVTRRGEPCLAIFGHHEVIVVRRKDGDAVWRVPWATKMGENSADPVAVGETLYVSSWWDMGAAKFDLAQEGTTPLWTNKTFQNHIAAPVLHQGCLFGFDGPVHRRTQKLALRCVDFATGQERWSEPGLVGSLIVADGKLVILTNEGELVVAEASIERFKVIARAKVAGTRTWAPPVLHEGRLYVRDAEGVVCLDLRP